MGILSMRSRQVQGENMEPVIKTKNVRGIEPVLRGIIGIILLGFALSIEGILRWVVGLIGVIFILTAIFGY
jgi:hypothetical protein